MVTLCMHVGMYVCYTYMYTCKTRCKSAIACLRVLISEFLSVCVSVMYYIAVHCGRLMYLGVDRFVDISLEH